MRRAVVKPWSMMSFQSDKVEAGFGAGDASASATSCSLVDGESKPQGTSLAGAGNHPGIHFSGKIDTAIWPDAPEFCQRFGRTFRDTARNWLNHTLARARKRWPTKHALPSARWLRPHQGGSNPLSYSSVGFLCFRAYPRRQCSPAHHF